ncbi:MAG TPA: nitroreductase family protein, partial [Acidimicrobiales bacterium]|nr:nitroreductase family protein [Acidimicrobiales bacterium]
MNIDQLLTSTRSARRTLDLDAPVDLDGVADCLRIALHAANGTNLQSWRWIVVADAKLRARVADLYRDAYLSRTGGKL